MELQFTKRKTVWVSMLAGGSLMGQVGQLDRIFLYARIRVFFYGI